MDEIKVAVIGYGGCWNMGKTHLTDMKDAGMTPVAVCEMIEERRALAARDFPGIKTFARLEDLLARSEAQLITIITPHHTHAELALTCLRAGRHVVCEKPLAITLTDCDAMIAEAKARNKVLSTYHNRHWDGFIMKALERVHAGDIGKVLRVDAWRGDYEKPLDTWRGSRSQSGGILYDWGVHYLEYGLQLMGDCEIAEVSAYGSQGFWAGQSSWGGDTIEDEAETLVRFRDGRRLRLSISHIESNPRPGFLEVTGTLGSMTLTWDHVEVVTHAGKDVRVTRYANPKDEWGRFYTNIANHLKAGEPLVISSEWARRPIFILDLAARSAAAGMAIQTSEDSAKGKK